MSMPQHDHQSRDQPARQDANFLDEALLDPEQQFIGLLEQASWRHHALSPAMPPQVACLLFGRLLKHGLQPTISARNRRSSSCRIAQCPPPAGRRYEVNLPVECPLSPLLSNPVTHDHPRDIAVRALVCLIGPSLEHLDADYLHVEQLDAVFQKWHVPHEEIPPSPGALGILRKHLPHLVEPSLCVKGHETSLERLWCDRRGGRRPRRLHRWRGGAARAGPHPL